MKSKRNFLFLSLSLLTSATLALSPMLTAISAPEETEETGSAQKEAPPVRHEETNAAVTEADASSDTGLETPASEDGVTNANANALAENAALDHFEAAQVYVKAWELELAEVELEAAIMYAPKLKVAHRDYCLVSIFRGHPLRAIAEFMMVVGLGEPVPLDETERSELIEKACKLHYRKGIAYARASKWDAAINEYKFALSFMPANGSVLRSLAFAYASTGDFATAELQYSEALTKEPDDAFGHADFAVLLSEHGQKDQAMAQLEKAVKLAPKTTALHVDLGWMAEVGGDLKMARTEFETAVALAPKQTSLWVHLAKICTKQKDLPAARNAYARAMVADPSNTDAQSGLKLLNDKPAPLKAKAERSDTQESP